jgi:hypothetical protein
MRHELLGNPAFDERIVQARGELPKLPLTQAEVNACRGPETEPLDASG